MNHFKIQKSLFQILEDTFLKCATVFTVALLFLIGSSSGIVAADKIIAVANFPAAKNQFINSPYFEASKYAIDEINAAGGLLGKQIELHSITNGGTSLGAKEVAQKAVDMGAHFMIGCSWSSHSIAAASVLQEAGIPMITPISTDPKVTLAGDYIFRACYTDDYQGKVMADFAVNNLKAKTAIVGINIDRAASKSVAAVFVDRFAQLGGKILLQVKFIKNTTDFTSVIEKMKKYKADVVYLPERYKESGFFMKQAKDHNINSQFLGSDTWSAVIYKYAGKSADGAYYTDHWHVSSNAPKSVKFVKEFTKEHTFENYQGALALTYDAVNLIAQAIRKAKSTDGKKIRKALANINYEGVTGNIRFDKNGDPVKSVSIIQLNDNKAKFYDLFELNKKLAK